LILDNRSGLSPLHGCILTFLLNSFMKFSCLELWWRLNELWEAQKDEQHALSTYLTDLRGSPWLVVGVASLGVAAAL